MVKAREIKATLRLEVKRGTARGGFDLAEEQFRGHTSVINEPDIAVVCRGELYVVFRGLQVPTFLL